MNIKELKKLVADAFNQACEEEMNGETADDLVVLNNDKTITIYFDIDRGRGGIDNSGSEVQFKKTGVVCRVGESIEGCGIEERVEELLFPRIDDVMGSDLTPEYKVVRIEYDTDPTDMVDIVEGILESLDVEYERDDIAESIEFKFELPE